VLLQQVAEPQRERSLIVLAGALVNAWAQL
jgi:hypothetical protein